MESGRPGADSGVGGDPCARNEKSPKLGPCPPAGGFPVRPLAIRHGVRAGQLSFDTPRGQGAPSTIRCIKTDLGLEQIAQDPLVREYPAPSGAFAPLPQKSRSWSSAQVPGVRADRCCGGAACGCGISISPVSLCSVVRTQGRNQAVVCGVVLRNSVPCVRNRELRAKGAPSAIGCIEAGP